VVHQEMCLQNSDLTKRINLKKTILKNMMQHFWDNFDN